MIFLKLDKFFCKQFILSLEEADTDLETDRLLGQQRTDDTGFFDEKTVSFWNVKYNFFPLNIDNS